MKYILILIQFLFIFHHVCGQQDLEIIKIKNVDQSVSVALINYSKIDYDAIILLELEGMEVQKRFPKSIYVPSNTTVQVCELIPTKGNKKIIINLKATPRDENFDLIENISPNVLFYSKNNQSASTEVRIFLEKNKIYHREYNVTYNEDTRERFRLMLERRGLANNIVKLPVLIIDGEIYYNVKNWQKFLKEKLK